MAGVDTTMPALVNVCEGCPVAAYFDQGGKDSGLPEPRISTALDTSPVDFLEGQGEADEHGNVHTLDGTACPHPGIAATRLCFTRGACNGYLRSMGMEDLQASESEIKGVDQD